MGRTIRRTVGAAASFALAAVLSACALGGPTHTGDTEVSLDAGPAATAEPSASATPSAEPTAPVGTVYVSADRAGIRFAVPQDWQVLAADDVLAAGGSDVLQEMADRMNMSASQLRAAVRSADVAAFGQPVNGFAPNINVQTVPLEEVPSAAQLRMGVESVGATVLSVEDVTTSLGRARVSTYTLPLGDLTVTGHQLGVKAPNGVSLITVSDLSADRAGVVLSMVEASLART